MAFTIDLDTARSCANSLTAENEEAIAIITRYRDDLLNLADQWQMDTRTVYQELNEMWNTNIGKMNAGMGTAVDTLISNAANYELTDGDVASQLRAFGGRLV